MAQWRRVFIKDEAPDRIYYLSWDSGKPGVLMPEYRVAELRSRQEVLVDLPTLLITRDPNQINICWRED